VASALKPYDISTDQAREEFIISYISYVNSVARAVSKQFGCPEVEDLRSCGYQGLLEAADNFDPTKNVAFKYYAYIRIYGRMLDFMRKLYSGSNSTVVLKKKINKLLDIKQAAGELLNSEDLAKELGMSLPDFQKAQDKINNTTFVLNFSDLAGTDNADFDVSETFLSNNGMHLDDILLVEQLWKIMSDKFPVREREIMKLIYQHNMTYPEIAVKYDITDRRVSQIHLDVLSRLRKLVKQGRHTKNRETRNRKAGVTA
jgi:RNA polymerase sigma factor for flagellar operon FliA